MAIGIGQSRSQNRSVFVRPGALKLAIAFQNKVWTVPLQDKLVWRVGRSNTCDIRIPDPKLANCHLILTHATDTHECGMLEVKAEGRCHLEVSGEQTEESIIYPGTTFSAGESEFRIVALVPEDDRVANPRLTASNAGPNRDESAAEAVVQFAVLIKETQPRALRQKVLRMAISWLEGARGFLADVLDDGRLVVTSQQGFSPDENIFNEASWTTISRCLETRELVFLSNAERSSRQSSGRNETPPGGVAVACIPVIDSHGDVKTILYIDHILNKGAHNVGTAEFLVWLASHYGVLIENLQMRAELEDRLRRLSRMAFDSESIVAVSDGMQRLLDRARRIAVSDFPVLILGETGVGKEKIARFIHGQSARKDKIFEAVNVAGFSDSLFESEMFGHVKGAFTGASSYRAGAFERANGGTLFLDEVGDLPIHLQVKLLRALSSNSVRPVGADRDVPFDVRLLFATSQKPRKLRKDFFHRIKGLEVTVLPLRERRGDILPLAQHFLQKYGEPGARLSTAAEKRLLDHPWPGNVRELEKAMQSTVTLCRGMEIGPGDLELTDDKALSQKLDDVERRHIRNVLRRLNGNKTHAAEVLGIALSTLHLKITKFKLR